MPNIRNHLQIIGNEIEVNKIKELVKTESKLFDFNKVIPMPELEQEEVEIYMSDELILSWCINNWGTKWNSIGCIKFKFVSRQSFIPTVPFCSPIIYTPR